MPGARPKNGTTRPTTSAATAGYEARLWQVANIVEDNDSAVQVLSDATLRIIARELG